MRRSRTERKSHAPLTDALFDGKPSTTKNAGPIGELALLDADRRRHLRGLGEAMIIVEAPRERVVNRAPQQKRIFLARAGAAVEATSLDAQSIRV